MLVSSLAQADYNNYDLQPHYQVRSETAVARLSIGLMKTFVFLQNDASYSDVGNVDYYDGYNSNNGGRYRGQKRPNVRTFEDLGDFAEEFPIATMGGMLLGGVRT